MSIRKMTKIEMELSSLCDALLEQVDDIGQKHGYSPDFYANVSHEFGGDFADIYSEWVEQGQNGGVPS